MKLVDLPFFVDLGSALEEASNLNPKGQLFDAYFKVYRLRAILDKLSTGEHARLTATAHDLVKLRNAIDAFERRHFMDESGKWTSPDQEDRAEFELSSLVDAISQFRTVLIADLRTAATFAVVGAGIFDVNLLVNNAHKAIADDVRKKLKDDVLHEIDASGKSLAFNLPTASGFHAMRAVERVIKAYLALFFKAEEIDRWSNWGQYIGALEKISDREEEPKPSQEAIALIRQIKDIYRNPVIHPERVLSTDEAFTLFHSTLAAINRIAGELEPPQRVLPGLFGGGLGGGLLSSGAAAFLGNNGP